MGFLTTQGSRAETAFEAAFGRECCEAASCLGGPLISFLVPLETLLNDCFQT